MATLIDLTHTIRHQMHVFPGEIRPSVSRDILPEDAGYVTYRLESNLHTGTHIDAPFHAKADSVSIDLYPLDLFTGKACVIDVRGLDEIKMDTAWEVLFSKHRIVLFCTGHSNSWKSGKYYFDYPVFDTEIAHALVRTGVKIAGVDSPSPDKSPFEFHSVFLKDSRFLIENLTNLDKLIGQETIAFSAFPLKIEAEASLIRAVASIGQ